MSRILAASATPTDQALWGGGCRRRRGPKSESAEEQADVEKLKYGCTLPLLHSDCVPLAVNKQNP